MVFAALTGRGQSGAGGDLADVGTHATAAVSGTPITHLTGQAAVEPTAALNGCGAAGGRARSQPAAGLSPRSRLDLRMTLMFNAEMVGWIS